MYIADEDTGQEVVMALRLCIYQKIEIPLNFMPKRRIRRRRLRIASQANEDLTWISEQGLGSKKPEVLRCRQDQCCLIQD